MKKIAIAADGLQVSGHFGHCEHFYIYSVEDQKIVKEEDVANPGHRPGFLPVFLKDLGAEVIICGGIGEKAVALFKNKGIEVRAGVLGSAHEAAEKYLDGSLESHNEVCHEHHHHEGE